MGRVIIPHKRYSPGNSIGIDGSIEKYRVNSSDEISEGSFVQFTTQTKPIISNSFLNHINSTAQSIQIDKSTALILYSDIEGAVCQGYGMATIAHITYNDITFTEPVIFAASNIEDINITKLNFHTFIVTYIDTNTGYAAASRLDVINDDITIHEYSIASGVAVSDINITAVSDISAAVAYYTDAGYGYFSVLTLLDDELTMLDPYIFTTTPTSRIMLSASPDNNTVAITYVTEGKMYVQQIDLHDPWSASQPIQIPVSRSFMSRRPSVATYLTNDKLIIAESNNMYLLQSVANTITEIDSAQFYDTSDNAQSVCRIDDDTVCIVTKGDDRYGIHTVKVFDNRLIYDYNSLYTASAFNGSASSIIPMSESLALIICADNISSKTIALLACVSDVGIEPATSIFTTEAVSIEYGGHGDFTKVKTKYDQLTDYVGNFVAESQTEPIEIGDFVDFVNKYTLTHNTSSGTTKVSDSNIDSLYISPYKAVKIDNERVLLLYIDIIGSERATRATARICKITGADVEFGNDVVLNTATSGNTTSSYYRPNSIDGVILDDKRILATYSMGRSVEEFDLTGTYGFILTYDGITLTRITDDRAVKILPNMNTKLVRVDDTYIFAYSGISAAIISTNANIIQYSPISPRIIDTDVKEFQVVKVRDDKFVLIGSRYVFNANDQLIATVITIKDGVYISKGPLLVIHSGVVRDVAASVIDDGHVITTYSETSSTDKNLYILNIADDDTVTVTTRSVFYTGPSYIASIDKISKNKFLLTYIDRSDIQPSSTLTLRTVYIDRDYGIKLGDTFRDVVTSYFSIVTINEYKSLLLYPISVSGMQATYNVSVRVIGHDNSVPSYSFDEIIIDRSTITRSNSAYSSDGFVVAVAQTEDTELYTLYINKPFLDRVHSQNTTIFQIDSGSYYIYPGDFVSFTDDGYVTKATPGNIHGVAVGYAETNNQSELQNIRVRTLYKR